jgi:hypothetical protein
MCARQQYSPGQSLGNTLDRPNAIITPIHTHHTKNKLKKMNEKETDAEWAIFCVSLIVVFIVCAFVTFGGLMVVNIKRTEKYQTDFQNSTTKRDVTSRMNITLGDSTEHKNPPLPYRETNDTDSKIYGIGRKEPSEDYFEILRKTATKDCIDTIDQLGEEPIVSIVKTHITDYYKITPEPKPPRFFENGRKIDFSGLLSFEQAEMCLSSLNDIIKRRISGKCSVEIHRLMDWLPERWFSGVALYCK